MQVIDDITHQADAVKILSVEWGVDSTAETRFILSSEISFDIGLRQQSMVIQANRCNTSVD